MNTLAEIWHLLHGSVLGPFLVTAIIVVTLVAVTCFKLARFAFRSLGKLI